MPRSAALLETLHAYFPGAPSADRPRLHSHLGPRPVLRLAPALPGSSPISGSRLPTPPLTARCAAASSAACCRSLALVGTAPAAGWLVGAAASGAWRPRAGRRWAAPCAWRHARAAARPASGLPGAAVALQQGVAAGAPPPPAASRASDAPLCSSSPLLRAPASPEASAPCADSIYRAPGCRDSWRRGSQRCWGHPDALPAAPFPDVVPRRLLCLTRAAPRPPAD